MDALLTSPLRRAALFLACLLFLTACKTEIYSAMPEREANEMMGVLLDGGVQAAKISGKEGFSLSVDASEVQRALEILSANGLPRSKRETIGQVFAKSGIVSSPFEDRVRYVYALSEEVAQTLQEIDGVLVARVHIVMPEAPALGEVAKPSSSAVFIRTREGYDLEYLTPQIRRLVANSIEGLTFDAVTVVLVESRPAVAKAVRDEAGMRSVLPGVQVHMGSVLLFWVWFGGMGLLGLVGTGVGGWLAWERWGKARQVVPEADEAAI